MFVRIHIRDLKTVASNAKHISGVNGEKLYRVEGGSSLNLS